MVWSMRFDKDLIVKEIDNIELNRICDEHYDRVFENRIRDHYISEINLEDKEKINQRAKSHNPFHLKLGIYKGEQPVGWHWGFAVDPETYYMQNSAIVVTHRNQGFYTILLTAILQKIKEEGFQVVTSTHHPNNTAILIPKLKRGFIITAAQFNEKFRFIIEMKLFFDEKRKKAFGRMIGLEL